MAFWSFANPQATQPAIEPVAATVDPATFKAELQHAYERGRLDSRPRRRGMGLIGFVLALAAAVGVLLTALAVHSGSFAAGGATVDSTLAELTGQLPVVVAAKSTPVNPPASTSSREAVDGAAAQSSR